MQYLENEKDKTMKAHKSKIDELRTKRLKRISSGIDNLIIQAKCDIDIEGKINPVIVDGLETIKMQLMVIKENDKRINKI